MMSSHASQAIFSMPHGTPDERAARDDIAYLERRLSEMGSSGDCAYERALAGAFRIMLEQRRTMLACNQHKRI